MNILNSPTQRILIPSDDGFYSAEILEFPGCFAEGDSVTEAMKNLEEAARLWIEAVLEQGLTVPEPSMNQGYGGKIALRIPRSLHREAARMAEHDGISLNQFLIGAIAERVGAESLFKFISKKFQEQFVRYNSTVTYQVNILTPFPPPTKWITLSKPLEINQNKATSLNTEYQNA